MKNLQKKKVWQRIQKHITRIDDIFVRAQNRTSDSNAEEFDDSPGDFISQLNGLAECIEEKINQLSD